MTTTYTDTGLALLPSVRRLIDLALDEDLGRGDVTTDAVIRSHGTDRMCSGEIRARSPVVAFGLNIVTAVFRAVDPDILARKLSDDGEHVAVGRAVVSVQGPTSSILRAERTALNFLQRLSGVATMANAFASAVAGTKARIADTRKTTPGYRVLEKAAVRAGGCVNHRFDLGSGILIKDNHIVACGSVTEAVARARAHAPHGLRVEVEVETMEQLAQALDAGAEVVLLDNMSPADVTRAAALAHERRVTVEVSGGVTLQNVRAFADAGADIISVGALTHSAPAVDFALDLLATSAGPL